MSRWVYYGRGVGATVVGATVTGNDVVVSITEEQLTGGSTRSLHVESLGW